MSFEDKIPLFPLSSHVLPEGKLPLRIFEPRYLRMVKESFANASPIGMCMLNKKPGMAPTENVYPIGTAAYIVDFEALSGGLLGITVQGEQCFEITNIQQEEDGLRIGEVNYLPIWDPVPVDYSSQSLADRLANLLTEHSEYGNLYLTPRLDDLTWICQRWLEILPLKPEDKQRMMRSSSVTDAYRFLSQYLTR